MKKVLAAILTVALVVVMGVALAACGGGSSTYTVDFDNIETWDYCPVTFNQYGDDAGVGMININSWGNKKLKLGADGTCSGVGATWTCTLIIEDGYDLAFTCHLIAADGNGYSGTGDLTYRFTGSYTEVTGGYTLAAPTYAEVTLTGTFTRASAEDFADYIPSAPWSMNSNDSDDCEAATLCKKKALPSKLLTTIFKGATFKVSGSSISSVEL